MKLRARRWISEHFLVYKSICREDSDPRSIDNAEMVALRGFSTKVHAVKTMVTYKQSDDVL